MNSEQQVFASRYNFWFETEEGVVLYNANSGAVNLLLASDARRLGKVLCSWPMAIPKSALPQEVYEDLVKGGFLLRQDEDELEVIRKRYQDARQHSPIVLTITTTMDCNLGCYYCYESRTKERLAVEDVPSLVKFAQNRLDSSPNSNPSLHVDWYGGEPLLNVEFMEAASEALQRFCRKNNYRYAASVISNGTCWPDNVEAFVRDHAIQQVQVSFDGLKANHDKRRRYRKEFDSSAGKSSFDQAIRLVDQLLEVTHVDLRFNADQGNREDLIPFVRFAKASGWFERPYPAVLQPARLASYSEKSSFMRAHELTLEEFDLLRAQVREEVGEDTKVEESEAPDGFPYPRASVCAALASNSMVIGADAKLYQCGLQVGEADRAVGTLPPSDKNSLPIVEPQQDEGWWNSFDPTVQPKCSVCSFLPICWSGCPKKHLEQDEHAIAEQGRYWRANLARLVTKKTGYTLKGHAEVSESMQFRGGESPPAKSKCPK